MSAWVPPTAAEFKAFFVRDFNYAPDTDPSNLNYILDADINRAISDALINFTPGLFETDAKTTSVFMYLAAFYLVMNLQLSSQGVGSKSNFPISSKSVGGVSVTFMIPERYMKDPYIAMLAQNGYGVNYLSFVLPYTIGNVKTIFGTTSST